MKITMTCNNLKDESKKQKNDKLAGAQLHNVILFNDDINTFDFVTDMLIDICKHDPIQAEQCTFLVHYVGKCAVKSGTKQELNPICEALLNSGLYAKIE